MEMTMEDKETSYSQIILQFIEFLEGREIADKFDKAKADFKNSTTIQIKCEEGCELQKYFKQHGIEGFVYKLENSEERQFIKVLFKEVGFLSA